MVRIFIVYGGNEGERIGRKVEVYFKGNNIGAFLASPTSPEINPGEKFEERIDYELKHANLAIIVVTDGIHSSDPAKGEIDRILNELKYPYIPFVKRDVSPPAQLENRWNVTFDDENIPESKFVELELRMWRHYDRWQTMQVQQKLESDDIPPKELYLG